VLVGRIILADLISLFEIYRLGEQNGSDDSQIHLDITGGVDDKKRSHMVFLWEFCARRKEKNYLRILFFPTAISQNESFIQLVTFT